MSGRRRGRPAKKDTKRGKMKEKLIVEEPFQVEEDSSDEDAASAAGLPKIVTSKLGNSNNGKGKEKIKPSSLQEGVSTTSSTNRGTGEPSLLHEPRSTGKWSEIVESETQVPSKLETQEQQETQHHNRVETKTWSEVVRGEEGMINYTPPADIGGRKIGELQLDEVEVSMSCWSNVLVCKVIGSFPPFMVMNSYLNRIWRGKGLEKVWKMDRGVFMARFTTKEQMEEANRRGEMQLDGKPIITVPWSENLNILDIVISAVPVWLQLPKLELKYWSPTLIGKIVSSIGKPIRVDSATLRKERLQYARVLVEINLKEELEESAIFKNEHGQIMHQKIIYEWHPLVCKVCKGFGHATGICRKAIVKQVYRPKVVINTDREDHVGKQIGENRIMQVENHSQAESEERLVNIISREGADENENQGLYTIVQRRGIIEKQKSGMDVGATELEQEMDKDKPPDYNEL